jgi:hypothetical protein
MLSVVSTACGVENHSVKDKLQVDLSSQHELCRVAVLAKGKRETSSAPHLSLPDENSCASDVTFPLPSVTLHYPLIILI